MRRNENVARMLIVLMVFALFAGCAGFGTGGEPQLIFQKDAQALEAKVLFAFDNRQATLAETEAMRAKICAWQADHNKLVQEGASIVDLTSDFDKLQVEIEKDLAVAKKKAEEVNNAVTQ